MDITFEEAELMLQKRLASNPKVANLVADPKFHASLTEILTYENIDVALLPIIEKQILIVLAEYAPLHELPTQIIESTGLDSERVGSLVIMIKAIVLESVREDLDNFANLWEQELEKTKNVPEAPKELKEKLELRPENEAAAEGGVRPLTRDEVLRALSPARTMAGDIASLSKQVPATQTAPTPPVPPTSAT